MRRRKTNLLEFYETPPGFTRFLDRNLLLTGRIYCPTVGEGAIVRVLRERSDVSRTFVTNDIDPDRPADSHIDATFPEAWYFGEPPWFGARVLGPAPDWVVENPPFSTALPILEHAMRVVKVGVVLHLRASFPEPTLDREAFVVKHPPDGMFYLPRYSFNVSPTTGKRATDSVCTAWCIWLKRTPDYNPLIGNYPFLSPRRVLVAPRSVAEETFNDREGTGQGPRVPAEAPAAAGDDSA